MIKVYDSNYRGKCRLEDGDLIGLVSWFDLNYPEKKDLLFHVMNESDMPVQGRVIAKKKGVRSGFPDLGLMIPNNEYHGLFIELKRENKALSRPSKNQKKYSVCLSENGYLFAFCYGLEQAKLCIKEYFA